MVSFYQESGRAGRDQQPSRSVLYYGIDDCKKMQFILNKEESKKLQSSLQDGSPKKSIADFVLMVEYCETSCCRRKKILDGFGEQVSTLLCKKSCDSCKDPNLVAKYLEELKAMCSLRSRIGSSQIFMSSSSNPADEVDFSEYWSRDEEAIASEDDISDDDDGVDLVEGLTQSALPSKSRISDKLELLQRAEEKYYQNKDTDKQTHKLDKNAIYGTLRESCKQRLLNALNETQHRLYNVPIDPETSSTFLENECHKKYGKTGKSFYLSQIASTVRWLSTTNATDFNSRVVATIQSPNLKYVTEVGPASPSPYVSDQETKMTNEKDPGNAASSPVQTTYTDIKLPPIPSFSEFVNNKNRNDSKPSTVNRESSYKRSRLQ